MGKEGRSIEGDEYVTSCQAEQVKVNSSLLNDGYQEGLEEYCRPDSFLEMAKLGDAKAENICPEAERAHLLQQVSLGAKVHCTKKGAYERGLKGMDASKLCSEKMMKTYNESHLLGFKRFLKTSISQKNIQAAQHQLRVAQIDVQLEKNRSDLDYSRTVHAENQEKKANLLTNISAALTDNPAEIEGRISDLEAERKTLSMEHLKLREEILAHELKLNSIEQAEETPQ